jgi:hypothetical protein
MKKGSFKRLSSFCTAYGFNIFMEAANGVLPWQLSPCGSITEKKAGEENPSSTVFTL